MTSLNFDQINGEHKSIGGKAYNLALLSQQKFPVPRGIIITQLPQSDEDWQGIISWWSSIGKPPVAVRSSASDEDDEDVSFAGQNSTYLDVTNEDDLKLAVKKCFESINKVSSQFYREHFLGTSSSSSMNILVQEMIQPQFAGVYFSQDPRGQDAGDLIEYVEGLAEDLVSGKKTPFKIANGSGSHTHPDWSEEFTAGLKKLGEDVREFLKKD